MRALKEFFIGCGCTVLLLDDLTTEAGDLHVQSIVHGVLLLEKFRAAYGAERRQFHTVKLRGVGFRGLRTLAASAIFNAKLSQAE